MNTRAAFLLKQMDREIVALVETATRCETGFPPIQLTFHDASTKNRSSTGKFVWLFLFDQMLLRETVGREHIHVIFPNV